MNSSTDCLKLVDTFRYEYDENGTLLRKTSGLAVTEYAYDVFGNLRQVDLPDGSSIQYMIDGLNRRVGKRTRPNDQSPWTFEYGLLYEDQLRPVAKVNENGEVVERYVYGSRLNVPEYVDHVDPATGSVTARYRIVTDHLGSPRLVVDASDGTVVQRMEYDEFGRVLLDTNPGFQPFGFAGGLYDLDTGLVRFGARDYDPQTGRWTAKDPILYEGGTNVYEYALGDPVNRHDPTGTESDIVLGGAVTLAGAGILGTSYGFGVGFVVTWQGINAALAHATAFGFLEALHGLPYVLGLGFGSVALAGSGGYVVGLGVNHVFGIQNGELGAFLYDLLHPDGPAPSQPLQCSQ